MLFNDEKSSEWTKQLFKGIADQFAYQRRHRSILDTSPYQARGRLFRINDDMVNPMTSPDSPPPLSDTRVTEVGEYLAEREVMSPVTEVQVHLRSGYAFQFAMSEHIQPDPQVLQEMQRAIARNLAGYAEKQTRELLVGAGIPENTLGKIGIRLQYDASGAQVALQHAAQALGEDGVKRLGSLAEAMRGMGFAFTAGIVNGLQHASEELQARARDMMLHDSSMRYEIHATLEYVNWRAIDQLFGSIYRPSAMASLSTPKEPSKFVQEANRIAKKEAQLRRGFIRLGDFAPRYYIPRKIRNKIVKVKRK